MVWIIKIYCEAQYSLGGVLDKRVSKASFASFYNPTYLAYLLKKA